MKNLLYETLKKYFGYDTFREYQEEIITSMLQERDTVAIMPTGFGKSLCYQLPAIISKGTTIVISPLISLMKDQVDYLETIGIDAVYLNSSLSSAQFRDRLHGIYDNRYKIIYVAPERLETEGFINSINSLRIPCTQLIIDEAHCVSRWGHDFRPSYTRILDFINQLKIRPTVAAFTATATDAVRTDIEQVLGLRNPNRFVTGFDRSNLEFKVFLNVDKDQYIREYIKDNAGDTGIIYTATRKEAERLNKHLLTFGIKSSVYHAGLSDQERNQAQEDFIYDNVSVMVATNAFGMGIDKSNVRYVIHYNMPRDLESYYQEAGRAGRDGLPSVCILLYSAGDTAVQKFFIDEGNIAEDRKSHEYKKLQKMESYCHTSTCLRKYMLEYFGDYSASDHCDNCSVCNNEMEMKDVTLESQMILSCINRSGQRFGRSIIVDALRGSKNKRVLGFHLDRLKTYGLMSTHSKESIELLMNKLIAEGYIHKTEEQYPVLKLTEKSIPLLKNQGTVTMQIVKKQTRVKVEEPLLVELKKLRKEIAIREGFPPYVIFHDAALNEMSSMKPTTLEEFAFIKGVGENKKNKYGQQFLDVIAKYIDTGAVKSNTTYNNSAEVVKVPKNDGYGLSNRVVDEQPLSSGWENMGYYGGVPDGSSWDDSSYGMTSSQSAEWGNMSYQTEDLAPSETSGWSYGDTAYGGESRREHSDYMAIQYDNNGDSNQIDQNDSAKMNSSEKNVKEPSYLKYSNLFLEGKDLVEVADYFGVTQQTVERHIFKAYEEGVDLDINQFIQKEYELAVVTVILEDEWDGKLKYIKEKIPLEVTYQTIKGVMAKLRRKLVLS